MMFCPKCKSIMMPKQDKGVNVLTCSCGYRSKGGESVTIKDEIKVKKEIEVVDKEIQILPIAEICCPKCKHMEAFFWEQQIRSADEPATRFFRCAKCKHTWRDLKSG